MGIHKIRRNVHVPGIVTTNVISAADLDVRSNVAIDTLTVQNLIGADRFRGYTSIALSGSTVTISAAAISSGTPVFLTAQDSTCGLRVSSIVDDISFMAEVGDAVPAALPISYLIME